MVLSHESEVFPVQRNSAALLKASNDDSLQVRLQVLAQEAVSVVMEADPAHSKELLGLFVADLFSQVAEQERTEERRQRQAEGIAAAKARGVRFGKKSKPLPDNFEEVRHAWRNKELTLQEAAMACGMAKTTFYNAVERAEQAEGKTDDGKKKDAYRGRTPDSIHHHQSPPSPHPGAGGAV